MSNRLDQMEQRERSKKRLASSDAWALWKQIDPPTASAGDDPSPGTKQRVNPAFNDPKRYKDLLGVSSKRIQFSLDRMDRLVAVARNSVVLSDYLGAFEQLKKRYWTSFQILEHDLFYFFLADGWEDYERVVAQRESGVFDRELRVADRIASDIFGRFVMSDKLKQEHRTYTQDARPLTFIGPTGEGTYYTRPPHFKVPLGIINIPDAELRNVWRWLALPHEVGHDTYTSIVGLSEELEKKLSERMLAAGNAGDFKFDDVNFEQGNEHLKVSGPEFAALLWRRWANESQADMMGLLNCGGAAMISLQQIIGFSVEGGLSVGLFDRDEHGKAQLSPGVHPTPYVRNMLNIQALRVMGFDDFANELQARFEAVRPKATHITWKFGDQVIVRQKISEIEKTVALAVQVLLDTKLTSLNSHSYREIATFTDADQATVDAVVERLLARNAHFDEDAEPRHVLAAAAIAFERDPSKADGLHELIVHMTATQ